MNIDSSTLSTGPLARRLNGYLDRAFGGMALLAVHEADALRGHWSEVNERIAVARRARSASELIRDQIDLFAESRNRVLRDQQLRRQLWRGWVKDLS